MTEPLPTKAEITDCLRRARQLVIDAEDAADWNTAADARAECDRALDLLQHLPTQRDQR